MDPFASPENSGALDEPLIVVAVSDAVSGIMRNVTGWIAVVLAQIALVFLGGITILGWIWVIPLITWGTQAFALRAIDGQAPFSALFDGWSQRGKMLSRVWGLLLILGVASVLLALVPGAALLFPEMLAFAQGQEPNDVAFTVKTNLVELAVWIVLVRFELALPLVVERDRPVLASLTESWQRTGAHWLTLVGLLLVNLLLSLPAIVLGVGIDRLIPAGLDIVQLTANLPTIAGLYVAAVAISSFANIFFTMTITRVYRQLVGPAPGSAEPSTSDEGVAA